MSQILDAINKAEKQRQAVSEQLSRKDLYQSLKVADQEKRRSLVLPLGISFFILCGGMFYAAEKNNRLHQRSTAANSSIKRQPELDQQSSFAINEASNVTVATSSETLHNESSPANKKAIRTLQLSDKNIDSTTIHKNITQAAYHPQHEENLAQLTPITQKINDTSALNELKTLTLKKEKSIKLSVKKVSRETTVRSGKTKPEVTDHVTSVQQKPTASWKKNIQITAIVYSSSSNERFVLIRGTKIYEGGIIPDSNTVVVKILPKSIIINDGSGDVLIR